MEKLEIKCKTHNFELDVYCTQCKKMICRACITSCSKQSHVILFYTDYTSEILEKRVEKLAATINESGPSLEKQSVILSKEITALNADLISFKKNLEIITKELDNLIKLLSVERKFDSEKEIVKNLIAMISQLKSDLKSVKPETIAEIVKRIDELEKSVLFLLNFGDAFAPVKSEFYALKKMIDGDSPLSNLTAAAKLLEIAGGSEKWELDSKNLGINLRLSDNNLKIEKINSDGHASAIGNIGFSKGIHKWDVYADNMNSSHGNGHWAAIGVIAKENFSKSGDYGSSYSGCTYNSCYNMSGKSSYMVSGKTWNVILNCDEGTLEIKGEGLDLKATGSGFRRLHSACLAGLEASSDLFFKIRLIKLPVVKNFFSKS